MLNFASVLGRFLAWANAEDRVARLAVAVPTGVGEEAHAAARKAGWPEERIEVIEVDLEPSGD